MSYLDEDFLKLKRREKYAKYSTLETGIAENICADAAFHC